MRGSDQTLWEGLAELCMRRIESELCTDAKPPHVRLKMNCRACMLKVISEALQKIATAAAADGYENGV